MHRTEDLLEDLFPKKEPKDISLLDLYESIEGKIDIGDCPLDNPCPFNWCIFNNVTRKLG
ncbi:MAG: hypothetical protein R2759_09670 [Bacteroidales bacterium]